MPENLIVSDLRLVAPEKVAQHRKIWHTFSIAILQSRNISADNPNTGIGGTFIQACDALKWLLSADAFLWLDQINCGEVVGKTLQAINYKKLYEQIKLAAQQSNGGRTWLKSADFDELDKLVQQADAYFKAQTSITA